MKHLDEDVTHLKQNLKAKLPFVHSKGGIYSWLRTPPGYNSEQFETFYCKRNPF